MSKKGYSMKKYFFIAALCTSVHLVGMDFSARELELQKSLDEFISNLNVSTQSQLLNIKKEAETDSIRHNIIHHAARDLDYLKMSLDNGFITLDTVDKNGNNLLHLACEYGNPQVVGYVMQERPELANRLNSNYRLPYEIAKTKVTSIRKRKK